MGRNPFGPRRFWPAFFSLFAFPAIARAHNAIPGMGEVANGFVHPLVTPAHVLVMIGLGLYLGQRKPLRLAMPIAVFLFVAGLGLVATTRGPVTIGQPVFLGGVSLCLGLLVATALVVPRWGIAILCAFAAASLSLDSVADAATTSWAVAKTLFGSWICFAVVVFDLAFYVSLLPLRKWIEIGIRVAGSWIVAISFLVLAFALKRQFGPN